MIGQLSVKTTRLAALAGIAATAVAASFLAPTATPADAAPSAGNPRAEAQQAAAAWVKGHGNALERASSDAFVRTGTFEGDNSIYSMAYERTHEGLRVVGGDFVVLANEAGQVVGTSVAQEAPVDDRQHHAADRRRAVPPRPPAARSTRWPTPPRPSWSSGTATPAPGWRTRSRSGAPTPARCRGRRSGSTPPTATVLESREQIAHGSGTAAYSGPNPLPIATSGSGSSFNMTDPTATTLKCQDAANNTTFTGTDDLWGNGNATSRETGCVDALYAAQQMKAMMSSLARPQRHERHRRLGADPRRPQRHQRLLRRHAGPDRQEPGRRSGSPRWTWWPTSSATASTTRPPAASPAAARRSSSVTPSRRPPSTTTASPRRTTRPTTPSAKRSTSSARARSATAPTRPTSATRPATPARSRPPRCTRPPAPATTGSTCCRAAASRKCDGTSTTGIGEQAAIKVLYNAMLMKTSSSNYLKYRTWTLTAAKNLDSTCAQFNAVKNAWDAVNVPAQTADPTCGGTTTPPTTPPTGGNILGNPGFESGATIVGRHRGPDHQQHRPPGPHRLVQGSGSAATAPSAPRPSTSRSRSRPPRPRRPCRTGSARTPPRPARRRTTRCGCRSWTAATATTLRTFTNVGTNATYTQFSHSLLAYKGKTVTVTLHHERGLVAPDELRGRRHRGQRLLTSSAPLTGRGSLLPRPVLVPPAPLGRSPCASFRTPALSAVAAGALVASALAGGGIARRRGRLARPRASPT